MYQFPIGVILESFRKPIPEAVDAAAKLGAKGLQVYATATKLAKTEMSPAQRKDVLHMVKDHGMCFSALCGDLGKGFGNPELNPALVEESKRILDIALEMETNIVTTHIGVVPTDENHPRYLHHAGRLRRTGPLRRHAGRSFCCGDRSGTCLCAVPFSGRSSFFRRIRQSGPG